MYIGAFFKLPQLSGHRTGELILKRGVATLARRPLKHIFPCNPARFRGGKDQPRWEVLARELCVCEKQKKTQCFRAQFIAQTIGEHSIHYVRVHEPGSALGVSQQTLVKLHLQ